MSSNNENVVWGNNGVLFIYNDGRNLEICRKRKEQIMKFVGKCIDKGSIILSEMTKT